MVISGVGEALRRERVRAGFSLDDVSTATKISPRFLKAIESEDFGQLPGVVFTRNFVRQYAAFLHLEPGPLVAMLPRFDLESAPLPQPPARPRTSFWDPRWNSTFASVAWTVLAGGAAVGAYLHYNRPARDGSSAIATVHAALPAQPTAAPAPLTSVTPVSETQTAPPPPAPAPSHPVQVAVTAREESWVQATADGKAVFATTLKAGETRSIDADDWVKIRTGNAGGVEIALNGKTLDPLGPEAQIRTVMLTAEGPRPVPASPAPQTPGPGASPL